jgi:hypothetical protein
MTKQTLRALPAGYGGLRIDHAKRLNDRETENARWNRLFADAGHAG